MTTISEAQALAQKTKDMAIDVIVQLKMAGVSEADIMMIALESTSTEEWKLDFAATVRAIYGRKN